MVTRTTKGFNMKENILALDIIEWCELKWSEGRPRSTAFYVFASGHMWTNPEFTQDDRDQYSWSKVSKITRKE
jgi:hypothetical protein